MNEYVLDEGTSVCRKQKIRHTGTNCGPKRTRKETDKRGRNLQTMYTNQGKLKNKQTNKQQPNRLGTDHIMIASSFLTCLHNGMKKGRFYVCGGLYAGRERENQGLLVVTLMAMIQP